MTFLRQYPGVSSFPRALPFVAIPYFQREPQIGSYVRCLFLAVSLPGRERDKGVLVTVGPPYRLEPPRVAMAAEPCPGRWAIHIPVAEEGRSGGELLGWIGAARGFALAK